MLRRRFFNAGTRQLAQKAVVVCCCFLILLGTGQTEVNADQDDRNTLPQGTARLYFVENRGQLDPTVSYYLQGRHKVLYFTPTGVTIALDHTGRDGDTFDRWTVKMDFLGGRALPVGQAANETVVSYFHGSPDESQVGLATYEQLVYSEVWPGIDLVYTIQDNQLKYFFSVQPGADPTHIQMLYRGVTSVQITPAGELQVSTPAGSYQDAAPTAYQIVEGQRVPVQVGYSLASSIGDTYTYGFQLGAFDPTQVLIVDPAVIVYAGFIGGSARENGYSIAVDSSGCAYVVGETRSITDFPATVGPDLSHNGGTYNGDAFIAKVKADGSGLVYAGFIGGSLEDYGYGVAVDSSGCAYVTGYTKSGDFPVTGGAYDTTYNGGGDAFVAKVNASGTGLTYATYIGDVVNPANVDTGRDIAVDSSGNAYVLVDLSVGPYGGTDTSVAKLNAAGSLLTYVQYIGGSAGDDDGDSIVVDSSGYAYVTGDTTSNNFPVTVGAYDTGYNGGGDAFVAKVNTSGTGYVYATYIGDSVNPANADSGTGIAVDSSGNAYVSVDLYVGPYGGTDTSVVKLNSAGSALTYYTFIGGSAGDDFGIDLAVDSQGRAYLTGQTASTDFLPTNWQPTSYDAPQEAILVRLAANGAVDYAGFLTGGGSSGAGVAVDSSNNAYVTGTNWHGSDFPATIGPDTTANGERDAFVAKVSTAVTSPPTSTFLDIQDDGIDNEMPAVAYNSSRDEYLVVWKNTQGPNTEDIEARRVRGDGTLYPIFTIATGAGQKRYQPAVAYSSVQDEYLVAYTYETNTTNYNIRGKRVSWNGSSLSSEFDITTGASAQHDYPAVAYNNQDDEYLVVYHNNPAGDTEDIAAQRVQASDGALLTGRNIATGEAEIRHYPDVAYNESRNEHLIVYRYLPNTMSGDGDILGKIASANLGSLSGEIAICNTTDDQTSAAVAAGPDEYIVVWADGISPTSDYDIYGRRVSASGAPQDSAAGFHIAGNTTSYLNILPAVAYRASFGYLVSWQYDGSGSYTNYDIYARYLRPGQNAAMGTLFPIDSDSYDQEYPAVACAPSGDCLVVEQDDYPAGSEFDIRGRLLLPYHRFLPFVPHD